MLRVVEASGATKTGRSPTLGEIPPAGVSSTRVDLFRRDWWIGVAVLATASLGSPAAATSTSLWAGERRSTLARLLD